MHKMIINSEDLRETLRAFQPFSAYERNKRLSNSRFDAPIWEDKVRIDIISDDMMARLTYDTEYYQITTNIHCDSNDDVRFYLNINDVLCLLENIEDEEIIMQEFYRYSSICDIMADLRKMKATIGHNDFGYDFIIKESKESLGRLQAFFARDPFSFLNSKYNYKITGQYENFSGKFLAESLKDFAGFNTLYGEIRQENSFIWYFVEDNHCNVRATNGHIMKAKNLIIPSKMQKGTFGILGEIAKEVASFVDNKDVIVSFDNHHTTLCRDGIFLNMVYDSVKNLPPFDKPIKDFLPIENIVTKKDAFDKIMAKAELEIPQPHAVDIHFCGKHIYLQCVDFNNSKQFVGDVIENDDYIVDIRLRLAISSLKTILNKCHQDLIRISIDTSKNYLYNISDISEPFSNDNAQLICGVIFDNDLPQLEKNEELMRKERGIKPTPKGNNPLEIFKLGEIFTRHKVDYDGEPKVVPVVTSTGVDVVLALNSVSVEEYYALTEAPLTLSIFEMNSVPFVILDFDKTMIFQFALNIMGMSDFDRMIWLNVPDKNALRIFHVAADTGELLSMRSHNPKLMKHIKEICKSQEKYDSGKVNSLIADTENVMTIHEMCQYAQKSEILKVEVQL